MARFDHAYPGSADQFLDRLIGIRARSSMIRQVPVSYGGNLADVIHPRLPRRSISNEDENLDTLSTRHERRFIDRLTT